MSTPQTSAQNKGPSIPAGKGYVVRTAGPEISVGATNNGNPQIGWRLTFFRRQGNDLIQLGSLTYYRVLSENETAMRITKENLQAFGAVNVEKELPELIMRKRSTLTGFGTQDAEASLSYRTYEGKQQPDISIFGATVKMKNELTGVAATTAAAKVAAMLKLMGQSEGKPAASTGAALPDFGSDDADANAENFGEDGNAEVGTYQPGAFDSGEQNADLPQF